MNAKISSLRFSAIGCVGDCSVDAADKAHPNKLPFSGTLLILDSPSNKPPHGAEGHRIFVPTSVAKRRLSTLTNMGLNYASSLDTHAPTHKVGVITGAWIDGKQLKVRGFIWKKDFPSAVKDLHSGKLGMSMELADVFVRSKDEDIWYLEDFHFSGATALYRSAAAYFQTALAAAAALVRTGGGKMKTKEKVKSVAAGNDQGALLVSALGKSLGPVIATALAEGLKPFVTAVKTQQSQIARMAASVEELKVINIEAAKSEDEEEETDEIEAEGEEEVETVEADGDGDGDGDGDEDDDEEEGKKKKGQEDDDDDDDAELDAEMEHLDGEPGTDTVGEINKDAKNMGDKTTRTGKVGKSKSMPIKAGIAASSLVRELYASHRAMRKKYKTFRAASVKKIEALENKIEAIEAQNEALAEKTDRKSMPAELGNFLAKAGHDVRELYAEGRKLSVQEVDDMFASSSVQLDPVTRMWFKNQLLERGLMEQGEIHRGL